MEQRANMNQTHNKQYNVQPQKQQPKPGNTEVCTIVADALAFLHNSIIQYIPIMVTGDKISLSDAIKKISQRMRFKNSIPTNYAILQLLMRLNEYAAESEDAFDEERTPSIPRSKGNVDYTLKNIWVTWAKAIEEEEQKQSDWQELDWNPYSGMVEGLDKLITRIWHKHFDVKNM